MRPLQLVCKACRARFESGIPLQREHLEGVKLRALEVCPACGASADYGNEDYLEPGAASTPPFPVADRTVYPADPFSSRSKGGQ